MYKAHTGDPRFVHLPLELELEFLRGELQSSVQDGSVRHVSVCWAGAEEGAMVTIFPRDTPEMRAVLPLVALVFIRAVMDGSLPENECALTLSQVEDEMIRVVAMFAAAAAGGVCDRVFLGTDGSLLAVTLVEPQCALLKIEGGLPVYVALSLKEAQLLLPLIRQVAEEV